MSQNRPRYKDILKRKKDWPIVNLSQNKKPFLDEVSRHVFTNLTQDNGRKTLHEELETTIYREKQRVINNPWRVDPKDDLTFWKRIQKKQLAIKES